MYRRTRKCRRGASPDTGAAAAAGKPIVFTFSRRANKGGIKNVVGTMVVSVRGAASGRVAMSPGGELGNCRMKTLTGHEEAQALVWRSVSDFKNKSKNKLFKDN